MPVAHRTKTEGAALARYIPAVQAVATSLLRRFPLLTEDEVHDCVIDALFESGLCHDRSEAGSERYLYHAAYCNVTNAVASMRARRRRERDWCFEIAVYQRSTQTGESRRQHEIESACNEIETTLPDASLRAVFRLIRDGERSTSAAADALGVASLPPQQQYGAVKRQKDRLYRHLRRNPQVRQIACRALE